MTCPVYWSRLLTPRRLAVRHPFRFRARGVPLEVATCCSLDRFRCRVMLDAGVLQFCFAGIGVRRERAWPTGGSHLATRELTKKARYSRGRLLIYVSRNVSGNALQLRAVVPAVEPASAPIAGPAAAMTLRRSATGLVSAPRGYDVVET